MAKNKKRNVNQVKTGSVVNENKSVGAAPVPVTVGSKYSSTFNPDYAPVRKDLKRIAVLAVIFFIILVALSFFLR